MSTKKDKSSVSKSPRRNQWDPLEYSKEHKFRVQSAPPLSLRQFLRSTITTVPDGKVWKPAGIYHVPVPPEDPRRNLTETSPDTPIKPKKSSKPAWCPAGQIKHKRPKTPEDEKNPDKSDIKKANPETPKGVDRRSRDAKNSPTRVWNPSGRLRPRPTPYFDSPSLRWSNEQIKQVMPEFQSSTSPSPKTRT